MEKIFDFIETKRKNTLLSITQCSLEEGDFWFYKDGIVENKNKSFFMICGIENQNKTISQPIIIQDEIGYIGIITAFRDKKLYFLLQAKIEPGNINYIQISPTLQATYSNFKQKHGGSKPLFLDNFLHPKKVLTDVLQSEQGSRFYKKRNRNIIVLENYFEAPKGFMWFSYEEINTALKLPNMVNMDARTALSQLFFTMIKPLENDGFKKASYTLNNFKMFNEERFKLCSLDRLDEWKKDKFGIFHKTSYPFCVKFFDIFVEGRENQSWKQPLFVANEKAIFGLFVSGENENMEIYIQIKPEIGSFDVAEFAPSVWLENENQVQTYNEKLFLSLWKNKKGLLYENLLSEEGGRFYHEENYNVIIKVAKSDLKESNGFWLSLNELSALIKESHKLDIQLRNLLLLLFKDMNENWNFRDIPDSL